MRLESWLKLKFTTQALDLVSMQIFQVLQYLAYHTPMVISYNPTTVVPNLNVLPTWVVQVTCIPQKVPLNTLLLAQHQGMKHFASCDALSSQPCWHLASSQTKLHCQLNAPWSPSGLAMDLFSKGMSLTLSHSLCIHEHLCFSTSTQIHDTNTTHCIILKIV
jgi:hypothetical protein